MRRLLYRLVIPPLLSSISWSAIDRIVRDAGRTILLPAFERHHGSDVRRKADGSVVTDTDCHCQRFIRDRLRSLTPEFPFLGEEMDVVQQRALIQTDLPCWCLDPLDGTSNFIAGMPCFAISLALLYRGEAVAGWIYDPVADELFRAVPGGKAVSCNEESLLPPAAPPLRETIGFIDFKRLPAEIATRLALNPPCRSHRNLGSCALEWAWLIAGRSQFIIHGGESVWDYAAGLAMAQLAGCCVTDFSGAHPLQGQQLKSSILAAVNAPLLHHLSTAVVKETT